MNGDCIPSLRDLSRQLATELVFSRPGADLGLLPANAVLRDVERLLERAGAGEPLLEATRCARRWIDEVLATDATWTPVALARLSSWTAWIEEAAASIEHGSSPRALPSDWQAEAPAAGASACVSADKARDAVPDGTEPSVVINADADGELLREFLNESAEHLQNIEQGVLVLEENPTDADTLNSIFRAFHTFKGGSGFLNLTPIQTLAHKLESLLDAARAGRLRIDSTIADVILAGSDTLKRFTVEIDARISGKVAGTPIIVPTLGLLARVSDILEGKTTSTPGGSEMSQRAADNVSAAGPIAGAMPSRDAVRSVQPAAPPASSAAAATFASSPTSAAAVKVDTTKLDNLVDLVGELVITQSLVVQNRVLLGIQDQQLTRDLAQLARTTKELQRTAMSLRMVPIRSTFQKMNRLVRDIAAKTGKQVELVTDGEETELDRTIVEQIGDPLVHMIRNAIDHGIERPDARAGAGKPAHGTVTLRAFYQGGSIVIEISDDGRGLDRQRLLQKGIEKGLVRPEDHLTEDEVFNLIFAAGFSTAETVTDFSGRGVGMDVVRRNIERLRGKIEIASSPGQGSTFRIHLPLTLAIIDGLIVGVGEQRYILPTFSVSESFRPAPGTVTTVQGRGEMISVRGRLRPMLRLHAHLGVTPASQDPTDSIAVVVQAGKDSRCILVDQLLGKQEVVIKTLGETFKRSPLLAGAAILGDGRVGLILDPNALVDLGGPACPRAA